MHTVEANGAAIPALGFGTWRLTGQDCARMVTAALSGGFRHIDTAQIYENETEVGAGIAASGVARSDIFLTTKVWPSAYPEGRFEASVEDSLRRLNTDYVDLLLLHWPNEAVPLAEQIGRLNRAREEGKTRHIGISNFSTVLMGAAIMESEAPLVTNQVEYHPYLDQSPVLSAARRSGMCVTAYYAMAKGKVWDDPLLGAIAARHGKSVTQIVLRWLVQQEGVVALTKTASEARIRENAAVFDFELAEVEMVAIHALGSPQGRLLDPAGLAPVWDE